MADKNQNPERFIETLNILSELCRKHGTKSLSEVVASMEPFPGIIYDDSALESCGGHYRCPVINEIRGIPVNEMFEDIRYEAFWYGKSGENGHISVYAKDEENDRLYVIEKGSWKAA